MTPSRQRPTVSDGSDDTVAQSFEDDVELPEPDFDPLPPCSTSPNSTNRPEYGYEQGMPAPGSDSTKPSPRHCDPALMHWGPESRHESLLTGVSLSRILSALFLVVGVALSIGRFLPRAARTLFRYHQSTGDVPAQGSPSAARGTTGDQQRLTREETIFCLAADAVIARSNSEMLHHQAILEAQHKDLERAIALADKYPQSEDDRLDLTQRIDAYNARADHLNAVLVRLEQLVGSASFCNGAYLDPRVPTVEVDSLAASKHAEVWR